ncbi:A16L1-like protein [Mya arenaria]|uniref:A16L1-like protein n=1 Tax=Mya arenaria TaxID=6604 RepID=A0ABY7G5L3_MYAAR|nr:A16L1-like protein [Mya arenaria]
MSDSKMVKSTDWKKSISQSLKLRNKKERHEFADLIESQNKLFEQVASLKTRNMQLTVETERLKADNLSLQIRADSGGEGGSPGGNVKVALLEQRLWKLSEELTEMHRRRGETVKDEHQALQVLFEDLTEKHCKLQRDKDELTARLGKTVTSSRGTGRGSSSKCDGLRRRSNITKVSTDLPSCYHTYKSSINAGITSLEYDPEENYILGASNDNACRLWSIDTQRLWLTLTGHMRRVSSAKFLRENSKVVDDNFKVGYDWSRAVFSPDGMYACAGSSDGTLFIWNIARGKVEKTLKEHTHSILACSWHPAGSYILSSEKQKKVVLWSDI